MLPERISDFSVKELTETSKYMKPYRINFSQGEKPRTWDGILAHDSVSILIYHVEKKALIFVRQFRPVVYYSKLRKLKNITNPLDVTKQAIQNELPSSEFGETLELCAGLIDGLHGKEDLTAVQEVFEECGYKIDTSSLRLVNKFRTSVGLLGTEMTLYYTEVNDKMKIPNAGGGNRDEDELIEIIEWPINKINELFIYIDNGNNNRLSISISLLYAVSWFKENILFSIK